MMFLTRMLVDWVWHLVGKVPLFPVCELQKREVCMETPPLQEHSKDSTQEMKELLTSFDKAWFHAVMFLHTTAVFIIYQVLPFSRQSDINGHLKRKAAQQNVHSLSAVLSLKRRVVGSYALKSCYKTKPAGRSDNFSPTYCSEWSMSGSYSDKVSQERPRIKF